MNYLKKDELKKLLSGVSNESHKLMILVGFWHGLRVSELISLEGKDIQGGVLRIQRLKKSKKTTQPFVFNADPELDEETPLLKLAATLGPNDRLFNITTRDGVAKMLHRAATVAGLPLYKCHPHALKHSIAMAMYKGGKSVKEMQTYLGHVEGKNTLRYIEATEEESAQGIGNLL
jgi:integrase